MTAFGVASGRATLAADAVGEGVPVVLLHAGVADRRMWAAQVEALAAAGYRAIAYDRRGFGDTLHAEEPYSHVGDLVAVLDACAPHARAILVGCSQGGRIAIDAALARPARFRGLALVAPAISGAPEPSSFPPAIEAWIERVERAEAANDTDGINALEAHAWLDGPLAREGRVGGAARERFLAMNEIALPTLVAWGDLDFPNVAEACEHLVATIRGARRHVFAGAAHLPNLEHPAGFNRMLLEFCASCVDPRG